MCCFATILLFLGPRAGILFWWLYDPIRWDRMFSSFVWPVLGFMFLPWTTLMYVGVGFGGIHGFDWFWMGLALLGDLAMYAGGGYGNRERGREYASRYG